MLIDEWQTVPKLWDAVRYTVDHRRKMGQFILTGSAVPDKEAEEEREHSGTGRFAWLTMRPMTLFESGESNGKVSLGNLFTAPEKILEKNDLKLQDIAFLICRGGWPMAVGLPEEAALEQAFEYYDAVAPLRNGQYGLIEVKRGGETLISEGVETLTSLAKQIDTTRMKAPAFKMILTATGEYAYRRPEDGIYIVPIGCLKQ